MCARYELTVSLERIIERFGLIAPSPAFADFQLRGEIRPTNQTPVILTDGQVDLLRWGLEVPWQKQPVINARLETASEKPTFQPLLNQRVLVPANAYFEWRKDGSAKIKTRITVESDNLFAMAGLWSGERFVILTCAPASEIAHIHNRMPVIVPESRQVDWMNPDVMFEDLTETLGPFKGPMTYSEEPAGPPKQPDLFS